MARETVEQRETEVVETIEETTFYVCDGCGMEAQEGDLATFTREFCPTEYGESEQHEIHFCSDCLDASSLAPVDLGARIQEAVPFIDSTGESSSLLAISAAGFLISVLFFPSNNLLVKLMFGSILFGLVSIASIILTAITIEVVS